MPPAYDKYATKYKRKGKSSLAHPLHDWLKFGLMKRMIYHYRHLRILTISLRRLFLKNLEGLKGQ